MSTTGGGTTKRRYTHRPWSTFSKGDWIVGTWHEAPRRVATENGGYWLGAIRDLDGSLTEELLDLPVGSTVWIVFRGSMEMRSTHRMWQFSVTTWPPTPAERPNR